MNTSFTALAIGTAIAILAALSAPALAQSKGDVTLGVGATWMNVTDDHYGSAAGNLRADDDIRPTLTFEYFIADNVGIEFFVGTPFHHTVDLRGSNNDVKIKHLPPTLSLQYHIPLEGRVKPFVGAGLNYTHFYDETGTGSISGASVSLSDSWGFALHAGVDVAINEKSAIRVDMRWFDIETDVKINGNTFSTAKIYPLALGASYIWKF
jgi:outer membrane protein